MAWCWTVGNLQTFDVKLSRFKVSLAVALLAVVSYVVYETSRFRSEDERYAEYLRLRGSFHRAASSRSGVIERAAALAHRSKPLDFYRQRYEERRQELLKSGYFVQIVVPVSNLNARVIPITANLEDTAHRTGFYYEVLMGFGQNEVRLVCRKQDVPLWEAAIKSGSNP